LYVFSTPALPSVKLKYPVTDAKSSPSGYSRCSSKRSSDGTDRAISTSSAVMTEPRGWVKSRRISRVLMGLSFSRDASRTVRRLSCTNSTRKHTIRPSPSWRI
jgi:hypothetical protein